jgi:hypothetical protein
MGNAQALATLGTEIKAALAQIPPDFSVPYPHNLLAAVRADRSHIFFFLKQDHDKPPAKTSLPTFNIHAAIKNIQPL